MHGLAFWLRDLQVQQHTLERIPVLSLFNGIAVCTDDNGAVLAQRFCQIDRGLTAERDDHTLWLFMLDDVHDIFDRERFKIEFVRSRIVCGNRLRIVVDDDRLISQFLYGFDRVHG